MDPIFTSNNLDLNKPNTVNEENFNSNCSKDKKTLVEKTAITVDPSTFTFIAGLNPTFTTSDVNTKNNLYEEVSNPINNLDSRRFGLMRLDLTM